MSLLTRVVSFIFCLPRARGRRLKIISFCGRRALILRLRYPDYGDVESLLGKHIFTISSLIYRSRTLLIILCICILFCSVVIVSYDMYTLYANSTSTKPWYNTLGMSATYHKCSIKCSDVRSSSRWSLPVFLLSMLSIPATRQIFLGIENKRLTCPWGWLVAQPLDKKGPWSSK